MRRSPHQSWLDAVDGARYVRVLNDRLYVWHGGVTVSAYHTQPHFAGVWAVDAFTISDEHGKSRPLNDIVDAIEEHEEYRLEAEGEM